MLLSLLALIGLAIVATIMIWLSSDRLELASVRIAEHYGLPEVVKGAVITAIASSFPELSSVILATTIHGEFELGVSAIVGSALFNILVIPAASVIFGRPLVADHSIVYKESLFYMIAISVLLLTFSFSVIYAPTEGPGLSGYLTRPLALIPVGLYAVYLFIQYEDTRDHQRTVKTTHKTAIGREWLMLLFCMGLVAGAVELLIYSALELGELFRTPALLWGLTIIAAGTSLPDLFISIKAARKGYAVASLSNVLGSNTFDLLIAVPVGVLIAGSAVIDFQDAAPMMGLLTAATIAMFILMRLNMRLGRREAAILLSLYGVFVIWVTLESFGITDLLNLQDADQ